MTDVLNYLIISRTSIPFSGGYSGLKVIYTGWTSSASSILSLTQKLVCTHAQQLLRLVNANYQSINKPINHKYQRGFMVQHLTLNYLGSCAGPGEPQRSSSGNLTLTWEQLQSRGALVRKEKKNTVLQLIVLLNRNGQVKAPSINYITELVHSRQLRVISVVESWSSRTYDKNVRVAFLSATQKCGWKEKKGWRDEFPGLLQTT